MYQNLDLSFQVYHFPIIVPKIRSCLNASVTNVKEFFFSPFKFQGLDDVDTIEGVDVEYGKLSVLAGTRLCPKTFE